MAQVCLAAAVMSVCVGVGGAVAQAPATVDFGTDVAPIFRQNCVSCHGAVKQNGGLRMDMRSSVMKAGSRRVVGGSLENSFVYYRVSGSQYGPQMPPTGDLKPAEVATIKAWIEQGAKWPDALANDVPLAPLNAEAVAMVGMLQAGDLAGFLKTAAAKPELLNARGPEGSTPFMYAVLYAGAPTVAKLLAMGADPNKTNDANATALMWAATDLEKTRVLVAKGAKVNVVSSDFRTALMIAARKPGGSAVVKLLLEHGADPNPNARPAGASSPLLEAATGGDGESFALLVAHGAKFKSDAEEILTMGLMDQCPRCVSLTVANVTDKDVYTGALEDTAHLSDVATMKMLLAHGADAKAADVLGRTALMYAAASDLLPLESVKLLVEAGADVNAVSKHPNAADSGMSVLDVALRHGETPVSAYLVARGAKPSAGVRTAAFDPRFKAEMREAADVRGAVQDSLPLVQRGALNFVTKTGCVSCHNNSLSEMTLTMARKQGMDVDETAAKQLTAMSVDTLTKGRDVVHQGFMVPVEDSFSESVVGYQLMALGAGGYKADLDTDAAAMLILGRQQADGEWFAPLADIRQPLGLNHIGQTVQAMRGLQLYAPKLKQAEARRAVQMAAAWLAMAKSYSNEDRSWRLIGLAWAGTSKAAMAGAMHEVVATQKSDGGWSDMASMESTAYATGKSLVALRTAGMAASNPVYQRGVKWLLEHQQKDGSWYVQTRSMAFQPMFDAGFPHGTDQFISSAGTNWAAMALTMALPEAGALRAAR